MFSTEHSLSRHIQYSEGYVVEDTGYKVKCQLCNITEDCCIRMISHVEQKHKRTSTLLPNFKDHYTRLSGLRQDHKDRDSSALCTIHEKYICSEFFAAKHVMSTANNIIANMRKSPCTRAINFLY